MNDKSLVAGGGNFALELLEQNKLLKEEVELLKNQNEELKDFIYNSQLSEGLRCVPDVGVLETIENLDLGDYNTYKSGRGFHFIEATVNKDIPEGFTYSTGLVLHRYDTVTVLLFAYESSSIAINSALIRYTSDSIQKTHIWRGWKIL